MFYNPRLLLVLMLLVGAAGAQTVYVSGEGDPCGFGGAYETIQDAVDAADDGDSVLVCADAAFQENVIINKSVDIRSSEEGQAVVVTADAASSPVLAIDADYVNISDFLLRDATGSYGLYSEGSYGTIYHVVAQNNDIGFFLDGSSHNNLTSNTAHDNIDEGFRLSSGSDHNILEDNMAYNQVYYGFYLDDSSFNRLISNTAYNSSSWYGFFMYSGATGNELVDNTAFGNAHHGFHVYLNSGNNLSGNKAYNNSMQGFRISTSDDNTLTGNEAFNNTADGFMVSASSGNLLEGNDAYDNLRSGFFISSSSGNDFEGNTAHNNSLYGFHIHLSSQNTLSSNEAYDQEDGFHVFGGSDNILDSNLAHGNGNGYYLDSSSSNWLDSNTAQDNSIHGFLLSSSSGNVLQDNIAHGNLKQGFYCYLGSNELEDNIAYGNLNGFLISSSPNNRLWGNVASNNSDSGIYIYLGSGNDVSGNSAYGNSLHGFHIYESPRNILTGNVADDNGRNGFHVYLSPNSNLSGNTAHGNTAHGFSVSSGSRTVLDDNTARGNLGNGFSIQLSSETLLEDNEAYSNSLAGVYIIDSGSSALQGGHYYGNTYDVKLNSSSSPLNIIASGIVIDNPQGDFTNYSNISLTDRMLPGAAYSLRWASEPAKPPHPHISFEGKYVEMTEESGAVSIDSVSWSWLDSEAAAPYREEEFGLWQHDGAEWLKLDASLDTTLNTLSISGLEPAGVYGILQNRTPPSFTIYGPADGEMVNTSQADLSWSVHSFDESADCSLYINGAKALDLTAEPGIRNDHPVSLSEGPYSWSVSCTDSVGTNSSGVMEFTVDFPPSVVLDEPDMEYINTTSYELVFTASDNLSSSLDCSLLIDGASDQVKSVEDSVQSSFQLSGILEGHHTLEVLCEDGSGNSGSSGEKEVISDQSAPSLSLVSPPDGYKGNDSELVFDFTANDSLSPTLNYTLFIDDEGAGSGQDTSFTVEVPEGSHNWSVVAEDLAGNTNESETRYFMIDRTPPDVEMVEPADEPLIITTAPADANITFNVTDDVSPTLDCSLYLDGSIDQDLSVSGNGQGTFMLSAIPEGMHEAYVTCMDETGNIGTSETRHLLVDHTPPSLELISPPDGYLGSHSLVAFVFNATDEVSEAVTSQLYLDGILAGSTQSDSITLSVPEGSHGWSIVATDEAGNTNISGQRTFTIDSTAPSITIHSPPNGQRIITQVPKEVTFSFSASDDLSAQADCTLYLDGDANYTNSSVVDGMPAYFTAMLGLGTHRWWVECSDEAGNVRSTSLRSVSLLRSSPSDDDDDEEPTISISLEKNCPDGTMTFTASSGSGTSMRLYDSDQLLLNFSRADGDGQVTFPIPAAGRYEIRASASSYRTGSREFSYSVCYVPPGSGDDGDDDGGDSGDTGNQTSDEPADPGVPDTPPEEPPPNIDPPPGDVEIIVNDTAYQGDDVSVRVVLGDKGVKTPVLLLSPENERRLVMTDETGKASFRADKLGRYKLYVTLPEMGEGEAFIDVLQKDMLFGDVLPEFRLNICLSFIMPLLLLLFILMAIFTYFAAREEEKQLKGEYQGYKRKKEGVASRFKRLLKKE